MADGKQKVLVGMSGGVDSSAAALLLKNQGYDVTGCTLRLRGSRLQKSREGAQRDIEDAGRVCDSLEIPHIVLDLAEEFCRCVVDEFAREYRRGRTPNPCVTCNRTIKFGAMLDYAEKQGFDLIATGHYVRKEYNGETGRWQLFRADSGKDQSYVLYGLTQKQLTHALFPLYGLEKEQVRELARQNGLPVAEKGDSMEICFVPDDNHTAFIEDYTGEAETEGYFVSPEGVRLGKHKGISHYTIGQRKGLGIALGRPVYVTAIDEAAHSVTLSPEVPLTAEFTAAGVNFVSLPPTGSPFYAAIKIRYQAPPVPARIEPLDNGRARILPEKPVKAVTPGQSVVFYDGDCLLGGGVIE